MGCTKEGSLGKVLPAGEAIEVLVAFPLPGGVELLEVEVGT